MIGTYQEKILEASQNIETAMDQLETNYSEGWNDPEIQEEAHSAIADNLGEIRYWTNKLTDSKHSRKIKT